MAELLKGAPVAATLTERAALEAEALRAHGIIPTLSIVRVGERPDDLSYERGAKKRCAAAGIDVRSSALPENIGQTMLMETLDTLNRDPDVHGILLLRPLPDPLDGEAARMAILPEKDVDGITDGSLAGVFTGSHRGFAPCTAQAVMEMLRHYGVDPCGRHAVIIGRSLVVGRPLAMQLMEQGATVTVCHSQTAELTAMAHSADILVLAAGQMRHFGQDCFRPGQVVIDVGLHADTDGKLCGDAVFDEADAIVSAVTPVPGGVGAVTTAVLASHLIEAARRTMR